jgi:protein-disulfide isomerase
MEIKLECPTCRQAMPELEEDYWVIDF